MWIPHKQWCYDNDRLVLSCVLKGSDRVSQVNQKDARQHTALVHAVEGGHAAAVEMLVDAGADVAALPLMLVAKMKALVLVSKARGQRR